MYQLKKRSIIDRFINLWYFRSLLHLCFIRASGRRYRSSASGLYKIARIAAPPDRVFWLGKQLKDDGSVLFINSRAREDSLACAQRVAGLNASKCSRPDKTLTECTYVKLTLLLCREIVSLTVRLSVHDDPCASRSSSEPFLPLRWLGR